MRAPSAAVTVRQLQRQQQLKGGSSRLMPRQRLERSNQRLGDPRDIHYISRWPYWKSAATSVRIDVLSAVRRGQPFRADQSQRMLTAPKMTQSANARPEGRTLSKSRQVKNKALGPNQSEGGPGLSSRGASTRSERLAAELRSNLKKRKDQERARTRVDRDRPD